MKKYSLPIILTIAGALLVVFILCTVRPSAPKTFDKPLTILHFNDTHSNFEPILGGKDSGLGGIIERAAFVADEREKAGAENVLLLHAGDWSQGSVYFTALNGEMEVDVINALRYDVIALGNHEFDNGNKRLAERIQRINCPVVCANYEFDENLSSLVKPYAIVERAGRKIGVIGLLADISTLVMQDPDEKAQYKDPTPVVNELAAKLRKDEKCDLVIVLSHLGVEEDPSNPDSKIDPVLASETRGVDLIVGGHSHTLLSDIRMVPDLDGHPVGIVQVGKYGINAGKITVD